MYAEQEGIVNVYADDPPDASSSTARAPRSLRTTSRAIDAGRKLTVADALALARPAELAPA